MNYRPSLHKRVRNLLRRSPLLLRILFYARGQRRMLVRPGITAICIEGYPRSANSLTVRMFKLAHPNLEVGHHTHTVANVAIAIRHHVPTIVLLRPPIDAVSSAIIASRRSDPDREFLRYIGFYSWIERHTAAVVMADFDTATSNWNDIIIRVNQRYGTAFSTQPNLREAERRAREYITKGYAKRPAGRDVTNLPLPSNDRRVLKAYWQDRIRDHPMMPKAEQLYLSLLSLCKHASPTRSEK